MKKIGKVVGTLILILWVSAQLALGAEVEFTAQVDQKQVSLGDTVTLRLAVTTSGQAPSSNPEFLAPDFDVISEGTSSSSEMRIDGNSGQWISRVERETIKILQPKKEGHLKIAGIRVQVAGKTLKAEDISIDVTRGNPNQPKTAPQGRGFSLRQFRPFLPGGGPQVPPPPQNFAEDPSAFFLKAEADKTTVYKGEQVIVSFYLYSQARILNIQVDKFPMLNGFLREDLQVPVMNPQSLHAESVTFQGKPFQRILLARYAAYPVQEGKLQIDSMAAKFNYTGKSRGGMPNNEDDPFFGFFQQMVPQLGATQSEEGSIQVLPLPTEGRLSSFTGGVGRFNLSSAIDKYDVHANEATTLTVKIEGRGNISNLKDAKAQWPASIDLYDTKGRSQMAKDGTGTKIIEYLLIPRVPGKLKLPPLEFGFFDPVKKQYYTELTDPIEINVLDPLPGTTLVPAQTKDKAETSGLLREEGTLVPVNKEIKGLKPPLDSYKKEGWYPTWRILYWACSLAFIFLISLGLRDFLHRISRKMRRVEKLTHDEKVIANLKQLEASAQGGWDDVKKAYEDLTDIIYDVLAKKFDISPNTFSQQDLGQFLIDSNRISQSEWNKIVSILEASDFVRFGSHSRDENQQKARQDLSKWIDETQVLIQHLKNSNTALL